MRSGAKRSQFWGVLEGKPLIKSGFLGVKSFVSVKNTLMMSGFGASRARAAVRVRAISWFFTHLYYLLEHSQKRLLLPTPSVAGELHLARFSRNGLDYIAKIISKIGGLRNILIACDRNNPSVPKGTYSGVADCTMMSPVELFISLPAIGDEGSGCAFKSCLQTPRR
jgi:hypothetical protein